MTKVSIVEQFREHEKRYGPSYLYGELSTPYDGCWHLNVMVFVRGDAAFITAELAETRYKEFLKPAPEDLAKGKYGELFRAGCFDFSEIEDLVSEIQIRPIGYMEGPTPYGLYSSVLKMCNVLGYDVTDQFICGCCGEPLGIDDIYYFQKGFTSDGGVHMSPGAPVCSDCFSSRSCGYCGEELDDPYLANIDEEGHCKWCGEDNVWCSICDEKIHLRDCETREDVEEWREGVHKDCKEKEMEKKDA